MAPEILRYEKYDAKADLWSVGTVLYEMATGRPPFKAANHIDLLRRIEQAVDVISFPEEPFISREVKTLVRSLLKRNPVERIGFPDFFSNIVIAGAIPDLQGEDKLRKQLRPEVPKTASTDTVAATAHESRKESVSNRGAEDEGNEKFVDAVDYPSRRPNIQHMATAPAGALHPSARRPSISSQRSSPREMPPPSVPASQLRRTSSRASPDIKAARDERQAQAAQEAAKERERAAQDVAFERDYVVVDKLATEVNAFADELAASPRIHGANRHDGALLRRNTTQNVSPSSGTQVGPARAMQIASGKRPEHARQGSYERRIKGTTSASSAISKAINMASGRLMSFGISPPLGINRATSYSPVYTPFPSYPTTGQLPVSDSNRPLSATDEDTKILHTIEESAHRSDVVYGFAEVKYKQLIPLAPSGVEDQGLGLREAGIPDKSNLKDDDDGLTVDAIVQLSEEALVLYVKSLSLLARSMDVAGAWWSKKQRIEAVDDGSPSPRSQAPLPHGAVGVRVNKVVQWVRDRFNEVLEKADFVRLKLIAAQKRLPLDHSSHPNNYASDSVSSTGTTQASVEAVRVSPGISAEKLMYTRALEMGKSAAVNELVCEDLPGCELSYITAIRMLEAVLDTDEEFTARKTEKDQAGSRGTSDDLVNAEDREAVLKGKR